MVLFLVYMAITTVWHAPTISTDVVKYLLRSFSIFGFVLLTAALIMRFQDDYFALLKVVSLFAAFMALLSIGMWYSEHSFPHERLIGAGPMRNPNPSAYVYALFGVLCVNFSVTERTNWRRYLFLAAGSALLVFTWLTGSRAAIAALIAASSVLLLVAKGHRQRTITLSVLLLPLISLAAVDGSTLSEYINRGWSMRNEIWQSAFDQIVQEFWFGYGYLADLPDLYVQSTGEYFHSTHNGFIGTMRYGGTVGLLIFLVLIGFATKTAFQLAQRGRGALYLALMVYSIICLLGDIDKVIHRPQETWVVLWLPLALIIGARLLTTSNAFGRD